MCAKGGRLSGSNLTGIRACCALPLHPRITSLDHFIDHCPADHLARDKENLKRSSEDGRFHDHSLSCALRKCNATRLSAVAQVGQGFAKTFCIVKKPRSSKMKVAKRLTGGWMTDLASLAAESRMDGGLGLHRLLSGARYDERPRLSMMKHAA